MLLFKGCTFLIHTNPNHIGCHTLEGEKEPVFKGSQEIERDLIRICAEEILERGLDPAMAMLRPAAQKRTSKPAGFYRNYFLKERSARHSFQENCCISELNPEQVPNVIGKIRLF